MTPSADIGRQRSFRVMGSRTYITLHGGTDEMLDAAQARLFELEMLWSRFQLGSDVTRANQSAGQPVVVHGDTLAVVARALDAWRQTDGRFDITVLPALLEHGYTASAVDHAPAPAITGSRVRRSAWVHTDYNASTLTVPVDSAIDLGGIGKGFAADIVAEELIEAGATGVVVNIGGDIVALGSPENDNSWRLGIEDPRHPPDHVRVLRLQSGGVATSGTTIRNWLRPDGTRAHHIIDPHQCRPSETGIVTATVLAADAATAEVYATASMLLAPHAAIEMLHGVRLAGLLVDSTGDVYETNTMKDFLA